MATGRFPGCVLDVYWLLIILILMNTVWFPYGKEEV